MKTDTATRANTAGGGIDDIDVMAQVDGSMVPVATATGHVPESMMAPTMPASSGEEAMATANETFDAIELSEKQTKALIAKLSGEELDIKPDANGVVFVPHTACRDRLNAAFGPFGWKLIAIGPLMRDVTTQGTRTATTIYREYRLCVQVGGKWHKGPRAFGEQPYLTGGNSQMTFGDAAEGCQSIGLSRCCKSIGMAVSKRDAERFRKEQCFKVFVEERPEANETRGKVSLAWRRMDAPGLPGETGVCEDSPNRSKYVAVPAPWWKKKQEKQAQQAQQGKPTQAAKKPSGPAKAAPGADRGAVITNAAVLDMWRRARKEGLADDDVAIMLKRDYGYSSSADIREKDLSMILKWIANGGD